MPKKMSISEITEKFNEINKREPEEATREDILAIAAAEKEALKDSISLEAYQEKKECSGKLSLRIPKELHASLIEDAKRNGVSLNQYALYKLSK